MEDIYWSHQTCYEWLHPPVFYLFFYYLCCFRRFTPAVIFIWTLPPRLWNRTYLMATSNRASCETLILFVWAHACDAQKLWTGLAFLITCKWSQKDKKVKLNDHPHKTALRQVWLTPPAQCIKLKHIKYMWYWYIRTRWRGLLGVCIINVNYSDIVITQCDYWVIPTGA